MEQLVLANGAGVSVETIKRLEKMSGELSETRVATIKAIQAALEAAGVEFTNGGQPGVRMKAVNEMPRLFRRDDVPEKKWVAFAFDYQGRRDTGFIAYDVLNLAEAKTPLEAFDQNREQILKLAAKAVDREEFEFDPLRRVIIRDLTGK
jgi:hypothetical protein